MAVYAVFEPPARNDEEPLRHAERFAFVRDGFSWGAFIFGPLWMLRHRLWLAFVIYVAIFVAIGVAQAMRVIPFGTGGIIALLLALLLGLEAATLRRRKLLWWRWRDAGIVVADDLVAAEQRFFDRWTADRPVIPSARPALAMPAALPRQPYQDGDVIGMFPGGVR